MTARFTNGAHFQGTVTWADVTMKPGITRANMAQESAAKFAIPWEAWKIHDNFVAPLTGTAGTDDLAVIQGVFGTGTPSIQSSDGKATTITQYARAVVRMPIEYDASTDVSLLFHAGAKTTISDGTMTLDVQAFRSDNEGLVDGADLYTGAAVTINSTTLSDKTFALTSSALSAGDLIDIRITVAITDTATGTAVIGWIGGAWLQCDVRG